MKPTDYIPIVVGLKTAALPDQGMMLSLQVCRTEADYKILRWQWLHLALHKDIALDLAKGIQAAAKIGERGPGTLE